MDDLHPCCQLVALKLCDGGGGGDQRRLLPGKYGHQNIELLTIVPSTVRWDGSGDGA